MKHREHFLVTWVAKTHIYTTSVTPPPSDKVYLIHKSPAELVDRLCSHLYAELSVASSFIASRLNSFMDLSLHSCILHIIYHIIYYLFVDSYRITKSMDIEIITFLGLKRWDQHKVYNNHMVQYSFFEIAVQYKLFSVIKYNKVLVINYYKRIK